MQLHRRADCVGDDAAEAAIAFAAAVEFLVADVDDLHALRSGLAARFVDEAFAFNRRSDVRGPSLPSRAVLTEAVLS